MIYPKLETESVIQENDKTRLDGRNSYANLDSVITLVEIDPLGDGTYYDITIKKYLDFAYNLEGEFLPVIRITDAVAGVTSVTGLIKVITIADDNLFSKDTDLKDHEDDILKWIREGRNSYLDKHRLSQTIILNELDKSGIWKVGGARYVASDIVDVQEFREWSKYLTLRLIYETLSNATGDIFHEKSIRYRGEEVSSKKRACLRLDTNGNGETTKVGIISMDMTYGG